jgi:hypothetical protein
MLEINHTWTSTGSSGAVGTPVRLDFGVVESVMSVAHSTLATTQSWSFQTAQESTGPWFTEASTSISTTVGAGNSAVRVTGPFSWVRPYLHTASTGTYTIKLLGVS